MTQDRQMTTGTEQDDRSSPGPSRRWRRPLAAFLGVVAALSLVLAVTATWLNTTLLDTDTWVETVAPLPSDPELQTLVAAEVADEVLTVIDLPTLMEGRARTGGEVPRGTRGGCKSWVHRGRHHQGAGLAAVRGDLARSQPESRTRRRSRHSGARRTRRMWSTARSRSTSSR